MTDREIYELESNKKAFLWSFDALSLYKKVVSPEEKAQGIEATLLVAQRNKAITQEAFIELVRFAYSD